MSDGLVNPNWSMNVSPTSVAPSNYRSACRLPLFLGIPFIDYSKSEKPADSISAGFSGKNELYLIQLDKLFGADFIRLFIHRSHKVDSWRNMG